MSLNTIQRRVETLRKRFSERKKRYGHKWKENLKAFREYKDLFDRKC
jgi:hypothetical protein